MLSNAFVELRVELRALQANCVSLRPLTSASPGGWHLSEFPLPKLGLLRMLS